MRNVTLHLHAPDPTPAEAYGRISDFARYPEHDRHGPAGRGRRAGQPTARSVSQWTVRVPQRPAALDRARRARPGRADDHLHAARGRLPHLRGQWRLSAAERRAAPCHVRRHLRSRHGQPRGDPRPDRRGSAARPTSWLIVEGCSARGRSSSPSRALDGASPCTPRVSRRVGPGPVGLPDLYRRLAAGVTVVTALGEDGATGMTASSVTSVSLRPTAAARLAGATSRRTLAAIRARRAFAVHLLRSDQRALAERFAGSAGPRFRRRASTATCSARPCWATSSPGRSACSRPSTVYGDHTLVIGGLPRPTPARAARCCGTTAASWSLRAR